MFYHLSVLILRIIKNKIKIQIKNHRKLISCNKSNKITNKWIIIPFIHSIYLMSIQKKHDLEDMMEQPNRA